MAVTDTTLDGYFKDRYADKAEDIVPDFSIVSEDIKFNAGAKQLGGEYVENVRVRRTAGHTFYGSDLDAFALNAPISGQRKPARVKGTQYVLREQIAYGVVASAKDSMQAFGNAFDDVVLDMKNAAGFAREMCMLYGGSNIGAIGTYTGTGTARTIVISEASWAAGLWSQMEGAALDIYEPAQPPVTKLNTNADVLVTSIDASTRTITVSGNATDLSAAAALDVLVPKGAVGAWFDGLRVLLPNTGSMHGLDAATYGLWKGNTRAAGGVLTFSILQGMATDILVRGGMGKLCTYVSPYTWTDLNNDQAALRRYTSDTRGEITLGTQSIKYFGVQGELELKPHPMVKAGDAFAVNPRQLSRPGATDITFSLGIEGQQERFFRELENNAGVEIRCYWNQGLMNKRPPCHGYISGINNASLS